MARAPLPCRNVSHQLVANQRVHPSFLKSRGEQMPKHLRRRAGRHTDPGGQPEELGADTILFEGAQVTPDAASQTQPLAAFEWLSQARLAVRHTPDQLCFDRVARTILQPVPGVGPAPPPENGA